MPPIKPRGSVHGLKRQKEQLRTDARSSITSAIAELLATKPTTVWTNTEVCRLAGLSSTVSLKKTWNSDLLNSIRDHNEEVIRGAKNQHFTPNPVGEASQNKEELERVKTQNKKLKSKIIALDSELLIAYREIEKLSARLKRKEEHLRLLAQKP